MVMLEGENMNNRKPANIFSAVAFFASISVTASADTIASFTVATGSYGVSVPVGDGTFRLLYSNSPDYTDPASGELFETVRFSPTDVGTTFVAHSFNDPDYASFNLLLTNGVDNLINWYLGDSIGGGAVNIQPESTLIGSSPFSSNGIDLLGNHIGSITFELTHFSVSQSGPVYYRDLRGIVRFETSVIPEPSSFALLLTASGSLLLRKVFFSIG